MVSLSYSAPIPRYGWPICASHGVYTWDSVRFGVARFRYTRLRCPVLTALAMDSLGSYTHTDRTGSDGHRPISKLDAVYHKRPNSKHFPAKRHFLGQLATPQLSRRATYTCVSYSRRYTHDHARGESSVFLLPTFSRRIGTQAPA